MPDRQGISVQLISNGIMLDEYDDPDYPFDPVYSHIRYIEVLEEQSFHVQIMLLPGFDFVDADVVRCSVLFDDDARPFWCCFDRPTADGISVGGDTKVVATATRRNERTGHWEKMPFQFGGLQVVEDDDEQAPYIPEVSARQARELGSIRVACFRVWKEERPETTRIMQPLRQGSVARPTVNQVLKKDMVNHRQEDKFLDNTVKFGEGQRVKRPPPGGPRRYSYTRLRGQGERNMDFEFRYRSRKLLRGLGIIRNPSTAPSIGRSPSPQIYFDPEPELLPRANTKRKRDIDESDSNGDVLMKPIEWKRSRTGELLEVVDLTED